MGPHTPMLHHFVLSSVMVTEPSSGRWPAYPGLVVLSSPAAGDDHEAIHRQARHGEVALDAASRCQHRGVGDRADRLVHAVGGDSFHEGQSAGSAHVELGEGSEVEEADALADGPVFRADDGRPETALPSGTGVIVVGGAFKKLRIRLEPLRALPSGVLDQVGPELSEPVVVRQGAKSAGGVHLLGGVNDVVDLAVLLGTALGDVRVGKLVGMEPADVGLSQVHCRLAVHHPLGDGLADTAAMGYPDAFRRPESLYLR